MVLCSFKQDLLFAGCTSKNKVLGAEVACDKNHFIHMWEEAYWSLLCHVLPPR